jgi:cell division cycle protein 20 (cofactor of APC complex)
MITLLLQYYGIYMYIYIYFLIISSGSRSGSIYHHDVRVADHHVATLAYHTQEVCGLKWSRDGKYLASGGNDNLLLIWDTNVSSSGDASSPLFTLTHHQAAVKVQ